MNPDPWTIQEDRMPPPDDRSAWGRAETLYSLANGQLGMRGDTEEPGPAWQRGTYLNGFHDTEPIVYGEKAFGFAPDHQTMLNLPHGRSISLRIEGEEYRLDQGRCLRWHRSIDLRRGLVQREVEWELPSGRRIRLQSRRLVSLTRQALGALSWELSCGDQAVAVEVTVGFDCSVTNLGAHDDPRIGAKFSAPPLLLHDLEAQASPSQPSATVAARLVTRRSGLVLACGQRSVIRSGGSFGPPRCSVEGPRATTTYSGRLAGGAVLHLELYLAYESPGAGAHDPEAPAPGHPAPLLDAAEALGFHGLAREQEETLHRYWVDADLEVEGPPGIQEGVRYGLFQLFQAAGRRGRTSLGAKGLSGEGYEGHYFWDTEAYGVPFFSYAAPDLARSLLDYRHATLPAARARAAELDHPGALYPWRTIDGREASAYFEAGTAQYHINADIVMALRRHALLTGDRGWILGTVAPVSLETARLWADLGAWVDRADGTTVGGLLRREGGGVPQAKEPRRVFCIPTVTGPDEYTALVDNNVYTNVMAAMNLQWAADLADWIRDHEAEAWKALVANLGLGATEVETWRAAADAMFIPWDPHRELFPQDESFFRKAPWYVNADPPARRPLLLHYHPLVIYRHQVLKQPDLVLAQYLRGDLFTAEEKKRHFAYYEPLTTGDSSLSPCIQAIMAARTGDPDKAWDYLAKTVRMDLDDLHGNARDGLHAAAMAGSWLALVHGFAGLDEEILPGGPDAPGRIRLRFAPTLPATLDRLAFTLRVGKARLALDIRRAPGDAAIETHYRLVDGEALDLVHHDEALRLDRHGPEQCRRRIPGGNA